MLYLTEMNGVRPVHVDQTEKRKRNYKLIVDPLLVKGKGTEKIYRYDGVVPGVRFHYINFCTFSFVHSRFKTL